MEGTSAVDYEISEHQPFCNLYSFDAFTQLNIELTSKRCGGLIFQENNAEPLEEDTSQCKLDCSSDSSRISGVEVWNLKLHAGDVGQLHYYSTAFEGGKCDDYQMALIHRTYSNAVTWTESPFLLQLSSEDVKS